MTVWYYWNPATSVNSIPSFLPSRNAWCLPLPSPCHQPTSLLFLLQKVLLIGKELPFWKGRVPGSWYWESHRDRVLLLSWWQPQPNFFLICCWEGKELILLSSFHMAYDAIYCVCSLLNLHIVFLTLYLVLSKPQNIQNDVSDSFLNYPKDGT